MDGQKLFLLSNGYDSLESYTKELYGDRGTFRHNLQRYLNSSEFQKTCRKPNNIDEIPEISIDNILKQIETDHCFNGLANHVVSTYDTFVENNAMTDDEYSNCAGVLGLCPGLGNSCDVLFPHLVDLDESSPEMDKQILDSIEQKPNIVAVMVDAMLSGIRDHHMINLYGHNLYAQGYARFYYRGENAYYGESRPSLFRKLSKDSFNAQVDTILGMVRIIDFL